MQFEGTVLGILLSKLCSYCTCANRTRDHNMINPEDDVFVDLSTSCSQDVAVMKLLGWSRGPILRRKILMNEDGISEDQMPFIPLSEISLTEQLMEMRAAARKDLIIAAENGESHDVLESREKAVQRYDALIRLAHEFSLDITDALNGEGPPGLILDQVKSQAEGEPYITLRSLDRWAKAKYGTLTDATSSSNTDSIEQQATANPSPSEDIAFLAGSGSVQSFAVTFGFLLEAFAAQFPKKLLHNSGEVNVSELSKEIAAIIQQATSNQDLLGQGDQSIRKRIKAALRMKDKKLRSR